MNSVHSAKFILYPVREKRRRKRCESVMRKKSYRYFILIYILVVKREIYAKSHVWSQLTHLSPVSLFSYNFSACWLMMCSQTGEWCFNTILHSFFLYTVWCQDAQADCWGDVSHMMWRVRAGRTVLRLVPAVPRRAQSGHTLSAPWRFN